MTEKNIQAAMQIILHAGDSRLEIKNALAAIAKFDFENANEKLKTAQEKITLAHKVQTDAIQEETQGETSEYSLLFTHAQDTLMTIYSELNIAKQLLIIIQNIDKRISLLEGDEKKYDR